MNIDPRNIPLPPSPAPTISSFDLTEPTHSTSSLSSPSSQLKMTSVNKHPDSGNSIKILESQNYHQWNNLMLSYFLEHNLNGIINGTELQPSTPTEAQNWILHQKKAAGFIARKLDSSNRDLFITEHTRRDPRALWLAIKVEYSSKKARNRSRLFTRFLSLTCSDGDLSKFTASF